MRASDPLFLRDVLQPLLVPYAMQQERKQAALSQVFTVTKQGGGDAVTRASKWNVRFVRPAASGAAAGAVGVDGDEAQAQDADGSARASTFASAQEDSSPGISPAVLAADLGHDYDHICHEVTLTSCTCQWPTSSGLFCRHQLAVLQRLCTSGVDLRPFFDPEAFIAPIWLKKNLSDAKVSSHGRPSALSAQLGARARNLMLTRAPGNLDCSTPASFPALRSARRRSKNGACTSRAAGSPPRRAARQARTRPSRKESYPPTCCRRCGRSRALSRQASRMRRTSSSTSSSGRGSKPSKVRPNLRPRSQPQDAAGPRPLTPARPQFHLRVLPHATRSFGSRRWPGRGSQEARQGGQRRGGQGQGAGQRQGASWRRGAGAVRVRVGVRLRVKRAHRREPERARRGREAAAEAPQGRAREAMRGSAAAAREALRRGWRRLTRPAHAPSMSARHSQVHGEYG